MLAPLCVAAGGSARRFTLVARGGVGPAGRDGKAGTLIELESWLPEVTDWRILSRSGLSVMIVTGVQSRVRPSAPHSASVVSLA
jgi:hypothetical protein